MFNLFNVPEVLNKREHSEQIPLFYISTMLITFGAVKLTSTIFLFAALAIMLYINIVQVGGACMNIDEAKREAADRLHTGQLSTLTISDADLHSGRAAYISKNEIRYDGSLYDIAATSTLDGKTTLSVVHDDKEERIISHLKDVVDGWFNTPAKNSKQPAGKQIVTIRDYIPAGRFTLHINTPMQEVLPVAYAHPAEAPSLAVLKSPPKFV